MAEIRVEFYMSCPLVGAQPCGAETLYFLFPKELVVGKGEEGLWQLLRQEGIGTEVLPMHLRDRETESSQTGMNRYWERGTITVPEGMVLVKYFRWSSYEDQGSAVTVMRS